MNLPNFINFEPFNLLRHKMRILKLGDFDLERYRREQREPDPAGSASERRDAPGRNGKRR